LSRLPQRAEAAADGKIVTFGVRADRPATEYGYIRPARVDREGCASQSRALSKSPTKTAEPYIAQGYLWNSGNFVFRAGICSTNIARSTRRPSPRRKAAIEKAGIDLGFVTLVTEAFSSANANSIDYAVMEKNQARGGGPGLYGWSDVGSWHAVWELSARDDGRESSHGSALFLDARNSYARRKKRW
jgi:mannose-1-phosphate guanylyltransferase